MFSMSWKFTVGDLDKMSKAIANIDLMIICQWTIASVGNMGLNDLYESEPIFFGKNSPDCSVRM